MMSPGEDQIKEFIKGDGLTWQKSKIGNIYSQAVERHLVSALRTDNVWWPGSWVQQPFGPGTRVYGEKDIVELIYDMEETAPFSQEYDKLSVLSGTPNQGLVVDSQIINTIMPMGLRGEIF